MAEGRWGERQFTGRTKSDVKRQIEAAVDEECAHFLRKLGVIAEVDGKEYLFFLHTELIPHKKY